MNDGGGEALESNRVMSLCTHNTFNNMSKAHTFTHYERHDLGKYHQVGQVVDDTYTNVCHVRECIDFSAHSVTFHTYAETMTVETPHKHKL